ncbi:DUF397 domain-containing protein [Streptomyces sp. NPDC088727]|uniref:DUF397 domain-containing protein n=1 Tax=Streptomyces sp. NPDC088727 TaxID=3365875 RepID=UPI0037F5282F
MTNYQGWHKSSYSGGGEDCVDQGFDPSAGSVGVRDTKRAQESPVLDFSSSAWTAFVADVRTTEI